MKIRKGFVSNSSSSSFLVAFDKVPESVDELKTMLFDDEETYANPWYDPEYDKVEGWPAQKVAETVWEDLQEMKPLNEAEIVGEINGGHFPNYPDPDWSARGETDEERRAFWKQYRDEVHAAAQKCYEDHRLKFDGYTVYVFEYSDNDSGYSSALEHGNLFRKLPHLRISHH